MSGPCAGRTASYGLTRKTAAQILNAFSAADSGAIESARFMFVNVQGTTVRRSAGTVERVDHRVPATTAARRLQRPSRVTMRRLSRATDMVPTAEK